MSGRPVEPVTIPPACPFVAFEDDRERRSTAPDHRHRCYAEPRPAPRALAHQERYCLTRDFPTCPTFQAWARREAARESDPTGPREVPAGRPPVDPAAWLGAATGAAAAGGAAGAGGTANPPPGPHRVPAIGGQLAAFEDLAPDEIEGGSTGGDLTAESGGHHELAALVGGAAGPAAAAMDAEGGTPDDEAPPFLAGRASGTRTGVGAGRPAGAPSHALEGGNPPWERPRRVEPFPTLRTRSGVSSVPPVAVALIALAIAAIGLFLLPSLLPGAGTPGPSTSSSASLPASASLSTSPSLAGGPTPLVYTVKAGDLLSTIASRYHVTLAALEAANPQIKDPNKIAVGDRITIPTPGASAPVSTGP